MKRYLGVDYREDSPRSHHEKNGYEVVGEPSNRMLKKPVAQTSTEIVVP
jgi:hypothetical protein